MLVDYGRCWRKDFKYSNDAFTWCHGLERVIFRSDQGESCVSVPYTAVCVENGVIDQKELKPQLLAELAAAKHPFFNILTIKLTVYRYRSCTCNTILSNTYIYILLCILKKKGRGGGPETPRISTTCTIHTLPVIWITCIGHISFHILVVSTAHHCGYPTALRVEK